MSLNMSFLVSVAHQPAANVVDPVLPRWEPDDFQVPFVVRHGIEFDAVKAASQELETDRSDINTPCYAAITHKMTGNDFFHSWPNLL